MFGYTIMLILVGLVCTAECRIYIETIVVDGKGLYGGGAGGYFHSSFSYGEEGFFTLHADCGKDLLPDQMFVMLCEGQLVRSIVEDSCPFGNSSITYMKREGCVFVSNIKEGETISTDLSVQGHFHAYILYCIHPVECKLSCTLTFHYGNRNNELGLDEYYLKYIPLVYLFAWMLLLVGWILNWITHSNTVIIMHRCLIILPLVRIIVLFFEYLKYYHLNHFGVEKKSVMLLRIIISSAYLVLFFGMLSAVGSGWGVIKYYIPSAERTIYICSLCVLFICLLLLQFVHDYFLAFVVTLILVLVVLIAKSVARNRRLLIEHIQYLETLEFSQRNEEAHIRIMLPPRSAAHAKLSLIEFFRILFFCFTMLFMLVYISSAFLHKVSWAKWTLINSPDFVTYIILLYALRLRDFSVYDNEVRDEIKQRKEFLQSFIIVDGPDRDRSTQWIGYQI